jgi:NADPH:quinone reductase
LGLDFGLTSNMRAVQITGFGSIEVLSLAMVEPTEPQGDEVRIRLTSCGLNRADSLYREGKHYVRPKIFPARIGYEGAGIVEAAGPEARYQPGARVAVLPCSFDPTSQGALAETMTISSRFVVPTPQKVTDKDAGALWMAYLTAAGALLPHVKAGDFVVITAASSSVGLAAIALCKYVGAKTITTTTSPEKVERLKQSGADHVICVKQQDYVKSVRDICSEVSVVFDAVSGPLVNDHIRVTQRGGHIIVYGLMDPAPWTPHIGLMIGKQLHLDAFNIASLASEPARVAKLVEVIDQGINEELLPLHVDRYYPLEQVSEAQRYLESNQQFGKIVVLP